MSVPSSLSEFTIAPPALAPLPDAAHLEATLRSRIHTFPDDALALANLANLLVREHRYADARELYLRATSLQPDFAEAWLAAGDLAYILRDEPSANDAIQHALALQRYYPDPDPVPRPLHVVLLMRDAPYSVNAPLELLLDRSRVRVDRCYVLGFSGDLPKTAVAMTAFGTWDGAADTVAAASRYVGINDPSLIARCSRPHLAKTLDHIDGVRAVASTRVSASNIERVDLPALVRPADTHAGRGLALIESLDALREHARRFPAERYDVSPFERYRSQDGNYRKYRIVIVDGVAYPYHLAISPRWMVHYQSSPMSDNVWMRREELAFLTEPAAVFPNWETRTGHIARALALDYVGLDVTLLDDGTMCVFEADPAMLVHDEDERSPFGYKRPFVAAIRGALERLIASR